MTLDNNRISKSAGSDYLSLEVGTTQSETATIGVVLLHGRGATAENILGLAQHLGVGPIEYRAPQAENYSWYPNSFLAPLDANQPYLDSALHTVDLIYNSFVKDGLSPDRIALMGFSQGACLALEYAARNPRRYAGIVAFSGGLIGKADVEGIAPHDKSFEYEGSLDESPVFIGCSDNDPHVPSVRIDQSEKAFVRLGAKVTKRIYPGMGHTINEDEIEFVRQLFTSTV